MEINIPDVVAEVRAAFERYETALNANDVDVLDASFWNDPRVIRYSLVDNAYAFEAIHACVSGDGQYGGPGVGLVRPPESDLGPLARGLARGERPRLAHAPGGGSRSAHRCPR